MDQSPHVFFTANQERFEQRKKSLGGKSSSEVLLLSVPSFSSTSSIVMLNMRTLEAEEIEFSFDFTLPAN